jgi:hypothetical protein|uniref:Uncharacterized protein n=1 Tax=Zea mays TaxID=4577 RepID=B4FE23_MAIZE|nr:unknown [Zea mays]|eukprot:NP_001131795.1 uncharacterized protein LOC100193168 [Zea mays]
MDDIAWERGRNADDSSRAVLTPPRGPGLLSPSSPSGSGPIPSAAVLALPASATSQSAGLLASSRLAGDMDGGGETLLVRRSKGKKRPQPAAPAEEGSGSGGRFRAIWRDYHDLLQVSVASRFLLHPLIYFALSSFRAVHLFRPVLDGPQGHCPHFHYEMVKSLTTQKASSTRDMRLSINLHTQHATD